MSSAFTTMVLFTLSSLASGFTGALVGRNQVVDAVGAILEATMPDGRLHMNSTRMSVNALPQGSRPTNGTVVADWQREYKQHQQAQVMETPPAQGMPPQIAIGIAIVGLWAGGIAWSCFVSSKSV
eukprot:CAMPEP_0172788074 /NCGR_PEP_ID=MMETSP1074-20121228/206769_1 /TAXON_ID=2916 /ORGANISM="Ceratium fusus, Strain PA161109" /LENGTH=124 /DNA_ID=CAMNT_0013625095 /DNA_START=6 /DNA_END=380 /DNA_ORIENTATION=-